MYVFFLLDLVDSDHLGAGLPSCSGLSMVLYVRHAKFILNAFV